MRKVIVNEWTTLDGVYQSNEDNSGGFQHGGWATPHFDDIAMEWLVTNVSAAGGFLLGRRTYEIFAVHWPNAPSPQSAQVAELSAANSVEAERRGSGNGGFGRRDRGVAGEAGEGPR